MKKYYGVIPPIITPIDENENVDERGFRNLLRHCIDKGLHGIFVAGTNGETMALTQQQRENAIRIALDEVGGAIPVMAGVMDTSTRRVIDNIKRLEQMGGSCAVVTPIFYARHVNQDETKRHFEKIARESNIDILIYSIPAFTGLSLSFETIEYLSKMDHVVGYKDSSGNFPDFIKCLMYFKGKNFCLLQGSTPLAAASMLMGADGFIPSISPLFPSLFIALYEAGKSGNISRTMELNELIAETSAILMMSKNQISANKCALSRLGLTDKRVIFPLDPVSCEEEKKIFTAVDMIMIKMKELGLPV
ncbi:MAG: dihydrodipicolinate synthase family protein [Rectinemataceae bacterium]|nr:dihydrodipicolinate synthase family protein [Spirochaetaceae bacterium]